MNPGRYRHQMDSGGVEYYRRLTGPLLAPHRWIVCSDVLATAAVTLDRLRAVGAPRPFVLAGSEGTGHQPDPELAEVALLGTSGKTIMESLRAYHRALRSLPADVAARIEAWDPGREARVLASWLDEDIDIAGRPSWGARPAAWAALEDKTTVDRLWDEAGVRRARSAVVAARRDDIHAAAHRLDAGHGTVWVGDNREGWHGGAEYLRVVRDPEPADADVAFFESRAHRVRIMPFLEGIPCSIHGMVFPDDVIAFRPVEMIVFGTGGSQLRYAGSSSVWDPPDRDRTVMRDTARRVGTHLARRHGYRGGFTIDGVLTAAGFLPTELNPRPGAGMGTLIAGVRDLPLMDLHRAAVAGEDLDYRPAELERLIVEAADRTRVARALMPVDADFTTTEEIPIAVRDGSVHPADGDAGHGTLTRGPGHQGGMVFVALEPQHLEQGRSAAPILAEAFRLADRLWNTGIGPLIPAMPAR
jgi:hypothetical protein